MYLATERYLMQKAPDRLAFVQDFLNTVSSGRTVRGADLLDSIEDAGDWISGAWASEEEAPVLGPDDLEPLRRLRDALASLLVSKKPDAPVPLPMPVSFRASLTLTSDGVKADPVGAGYRRVASKLLLDLLQAEVEGNARRLKVCPNEWCHVAFFDRSKNVSAVWHDSSSCGNLANVRASRQRRRGDMYAQLSAN